MERRRLAGGTWLVTILVLVVGLPLAGAAMAGRDLTTLGRFPPRLEVPVDYLRFSWLAAGAVVACVAALAVGWIAGDKRSHEETANVERPGRFPRWGWLAVAWTLAWWVLAWTRFPWFEAGQRFTYFPLWLGFIGVVNALTQRRTGTCLMRRAPGRGLALFAVSAAFWWLFEWLNRFVRNWHYLGVEELGAFGYALHATICFSTVLPAIASVAEWLASHAWWQDRMAAGPIWSAIEKRSVAWALAGAGVAGLVLTGAFPNGFYPALWVAPLALLLGEAVITRRRSAIQELARGDWRRVGSWMLAALLCGLFWELWNLHSAAKWIYTVPGVQRWHVFEMPLLGYAGYLPFGLECLLVAERIVGARAEW